MTTRATIYMCNSVEYYMIQKLCTLNDNKEIIVHTSHIWGASKSCNLTQIDIKPPTGSVWKAETNSEHTNSHHPPPRRCRGFLPDGFIPAFRVWFIEADGSSCQVSERHYWAGDSSPWAHRGPHAPPPHDPPWVVSNCSVDPQEWFKRCCHFLNWSMHQWRSFY